MLVGRARVLRKADLQIGSRLRIAPGHIPAAQRATIDAAAGELVALGFALSCWERIQPIVRARCVDHWGATLWQESWRTFALLTATAAPDADHPLAVNFWSLLRDGSRLVTRNGDAHAVLGADARTEEQDVHARTLAAQCDAHFERLRALPPARHPVRATQAQVADAVRDDARARLAGMAAVGDLAETEDTAWRFTRRGARRWASILDGRARGRRVAARVASARAAGRSAPARPVRSRASRASRARAPARR
jgi:hypothetical protein